MTEFTPVELLKASAREWAKQIGTFPTTVTQHKPSVCTQDQKAIRRTFLPKPHLAI